MPGRSSENALYTVTGFLSKALDKGGKALSIFLDLVKAFDAVDHNLLCKTFKSFSITGICLRWFVRYLSKRKQFTNVNSLLGRDNEVMYDVFQGSVLGLILFVMYIVCVI